MCARYTITTKPEIIVTKFIGKRLDEDYRPNYNIAPTQLAPVIIADRPDQIQMFHFGLVPFWSKDTKAGYKMLNARSETILQLPSFKPLMIHNKRCLILADSFYEWKTEGKEKLPYRFTLPERDIFAFAGLWSQWKSADKTSVYESFSIITTEPNEKVATLHNRMPVILSERNYSVWLDGGVPAAELLNLCVPYEADQMDMYRVSKDVNVVKNNHEGLILPQNSK